MQRTHRTTVRSLVAAAVLVGTVAGFTAPHATAALPRVMVPIGSDYQAPTMQLFARAAAAQDRSGTVRLLVLPITYSLDAFTSSKSERKKNLTLADNRRAMLQDACNAVKSPSQTCETVLLPTLTRADAYVQSNIDAFTPDVDGMFVLGGDQTVAMQLVAGTPLEDAMAAAYGRGAVMGGNSAGDAVQSRNMINGFSAGFDVPQSLQQGAVDVWTYDGPGDLTRGLVFGLPTVIDEQHVFERGRIGRAVNVAVTQQMPVLGMDAATGGVMVDETTLTEVAGLSGGIVIDPRTLGATASFGGPNHTLSTRGVVTHLVPGGTNGFSFATMQPTVNGVAQPAPSFAGRAYPTFGTPTSAGSLILSGGFREQPAGAVGNTFVQRAGGASAAIVVLTIGYAKTTAAQADAKAIAAALQPGVTSTVKWVAVDSKTNVADTVAAIQGASGIVLTSADASLVLPALAAQPAITAAVRTRWSTGAALLADDAAAAALGTKLSTDGPAADIELDASLDFVQGNVAVANGLAWVTNLSVTPRLLPQHRWGQAYQVLAAAPQSLSLGIDVGTAVEVRNGTATAIGDNAVVALDGRVATFGAGTNGGLAARWTVLDTFVSGQTLHS